MPDTKQLWTVPILQFEAKHGTIETVKNLIYAIIAEIIADCPVDTGALKTSIYANIQIEYHDEH